MIKIDQAVIVEGKYDKIRLSSILDTIIIETNGFSIFKDKEKQALIRLLAEKRGLVVMTDSDSAGFKIRSFISGMVKPENIIHVYTPDIFGKERRKEHPSKEGKLGVEGIDNEVLIKALERSGIKTGESEAKAPEGRQITAYDLYEDGLSGGKDSSEKRRKLTDKLMLPERISTSSLIKILNITMSYEEYKVLVTALF